MTIRHPASRSRRRWSVLLPVVAAVSLLAACGGGDGDGDGGSADGGASTLEEAQESGSITIGIADEAPYGYVGPDGEATGQAPEVARVVLEELGIEEVEARTVGFDSLIPGLNAGQFDMIAAGMFITPERAEAILFSDPDYCATTAFGVEAGNPLGLEDFDDVAANDEARLGVVGGTAEVGYAEGAGVPADRTQQFPSTPDLFDALTAGRIDAAALTTPTVNTQIERIGDEGYEATEGFIPVIDGEEQLGCGGYGFRQDDQELRDAFNDVLVEMKENDEILPIIEEFGFSEADVEAAKDLTVEDLAGEEAGS